MHPGIWTNEPVISGLILLYDGMIRNQEEANFVELRLGFEL